MPRKLTRVQNHQKRPIAFKGMSGCLRQAAVDANLTKKIAVNKTTIYNDKQPNGSRRFHWEGCMSKNDICESDLEDFRLALIPLFKEHGLSIDKIDRGWRSIYVWVLPSQEVKIEDVRSAAKKLGYRLVKIKS